MDQIYDDVNEIYNDILGESNEKLLENLPPKNLNSAILDYEHNGIIMKHILDEKLIQGFILFHQVKENFMLFHIQILFTF